MTRRRAHTHRTSDKGTVLYAKELRKNRTEAEMVLWERLRRKAVEGFRFRQQHPIGPYIADFFCNEALLVIEVDGGVHYGAEQKDKDRLREAAMAEHGLTILRFSNQEIFVSLDVVVERIRTTLRAQVAKSPLPNPPPIYDRRSGEGAIASNHTISGPGFSPSPNVQMSTGGGPGRGPNIDRTSRKGCDKNSRQIKGEG